MSHVPDFASLVQHFKCFSCDFAAASGARVNNCGLVKERVRACWNLKEIMQKQRVCVSWLFRARKNIEQRIILSRSTEHHDELRLGLSGVCGIVESLVAVPNKNGASP